MSLSAQKQPPESRSSYVIEQLAGETMSIPGTKTVVRILASSKQTGGTMAVFGYNGITGDPAGFHYHKEAHDVFMVTKGAMQLWAGDQCRILGPGDFAYVPPNVIHNPQIVGPITETFGLVAPGDWVDFFRAISGPYAGIMAPEFDNRDTKAAIIPKLMEAKDKYDVHFVGPEYEPAALSDWQDSDTKLPSGCETYFLKANRGPRWVVGGVLSRPFITTVQSGGKFAVSSIESSNTYESAVLKRYLTFATVDHCFIVQEGALEVKLKDKAGWTTVRAGETLVVSAGQAFAWDFVMKYVRVISFANGKGIEELVQSAGAASEGLLLPDEAAAVDEERWKSTCATLNVTSEAM